MLNSTITEETTGREINISLCMDKKNKVIFNKETESWIEAKQYADVSLLFPHSGSPLWIYKHWNFKCLSISPSTKILPNGASFSSFVTSESCTVSVKSAVDGAVLAWEVSVVSSFPGSFVRKFKPHSKQKVCFSSRASFLQFGHFIFSVLGWISSQTLINSRDCSSFASFSERRKWVPGREGLGKLPLFEKWDEGNGEGGSKRLWISPWAFSKDL